MARPISPTPILNEEDAVRIFMKMAAKPTKKDKEFKKRFDKQRKVSF